MDVITVRLTQRYDGERLQLVARPRGRMLLITTSCDGSGLRKLEVPDSALEAMIFVPLAQLGGMQVEYGNSFPQ